MALPIKCYADEPGTDTHSTSAAVSASHGKNETLQELGTGIQPLNLHGPVQGSGTSNSKVEIQNPSGRGTLGQPLPSQAAPLPPLVPLGSHTTVTPQSIPPPAFGPSGRR